MNSPKEVLDKLVAGDFQSLIGITESVWIDAKEIPYILDSPKKKLELAKDVSAFANSGGGIIVIGFDASKDPLMAVETISKVCPFPLSLLDSNQYRQILGKSVYPPLNGVAIQTFDSGAGDGRGAAAIIIDSVLTADKPYLVANMLDEAGQSIGAYMGLFERKHDLIPPISIARLQQLLAVGQQWSSINDRLLAIESNVSSWTAPKPAPPIPGVTKVERETRLKAARIAMGRDDAPIIYFTATPQGECDFPALFKSRAERVVRLIENPPQLRQNGFEIWADRMAEIIQGRLRRNMIGGHRLLELWKDGLFIFIAPGDEDFLGWAVTSGSEKPIRISNFALAEATLVFCWLVQQVFEEANPRPPTIRLSVGFDNMTRDAGPATLRNIPEGKMVGFSGPKPAPGPEREVSELAAWDDYDPAHLAYLLVEHIFHWFGYESQDIPYVDNTGSKHRLSAQQIIEKPLPVGVVPAPDYS